MGVHQDEDGNAVNVLESRSSGTEEFHGMDVGSDYAYDVAPFGNLNTDTLRTRQGECEESTTWIFCWF